ncbi:MAG: diguanylate cyclase [Pseudomonadota bacterium]|nr:diguanylate cyclase [Pseudomonadota bacterium]
MTGRILIADDRFASRLMLSALFSGAFYDVMQADRSEDVGAIVQKDQPGAVLISDGISGLGALALCDSLRGGDETRHVLRIVLTDRADATRCAMLIKAGADEVIPRSCSDAEILARVRRLFEYRARMSDLTMQELPGIRPAGLAEAAGAFAPPPRVAIFSGDAQAEDWARALSLPAVQVLGPADALPPGVDLALLDADSLGRDATLRLTARAARLDQEAGPEVLLAHSGPGSTDPAVVIEALDYGAGGVMTLPFHADEALARLTLLADRRRAMLRTRDQLRHGLQSALTDPLTGLYNRRYALPRLDQLIRDSRTRSTPVAVLMGDLDHFKWVNDTFGHPAGDAVLQAIGRCLSDTLGTSGIASRVGGEEFLILLPGCARAEASALARRLRLAVARTCVPYPGAPDGLQVTMSIGLATLDGPAARQFRTPEEDASRLLTRADQALYRAKAAGRDCVISDFRRSVRKAPEDVLPRVASG